MDNYCNLLPYELIEIVISYLTNKELDNFILIFDKYKTILDWNKIFLYHFKYFKMIDYKLYDIFVSIENLKNKLNIISYTVEDIYNIRILDLSRYQLKEIPIEVFKLINLEELYLHNNPLIDIPTAIKNLTNLHILELSNTQITFNSFQLCKLPKLRKLYIFNIPINKNELNKIRILFPNTEIYYHS